MPYGELRVDTITYTSGGVDSSVTVSGIVAGPSTGIAITGNISGNTIIGTTGTFTSLTGTTTTGTTANFTTGIFNTRLGVGTTPTTNTRLDISGSYAQNISAVSVLDINCSTSNFFTKTINGNSTFTFSNVPSSRAFSFTLELTHTSGTVTWPAAVKWPADTAPTLTTGKTHLFIFVTDDGGTRWRGAALVDYVN